MNGHTHRPVDERGPLAYVGCVAAEDCQPDAHGGVRYVDRCECGATQHVNANHATVERGPWEPAAGDQN